MTAFRDRVTPNLSLISVATSLADMFGHSSLRAESISSFQAITFPAPQLRSQMLERNVVFQVL